MADIRMSLEDRIKQVNEVTIKDKNLIRYFMENICKVKLLTLAYGYPANQIQDEIGIFHSFCMLLDIPERFYDSISMGEFMVAWQKFLSRAIRERYSSGEILTILSGFLCYPYDETCKNYSFTGESYVLSNFVRLNLKSYLDISDELKRNADPDNKVSSYENITSNDNYPEINADTNMGEALNMAYKTVYDILDIKNMRLNDDGEIIYQRFDSDDFDTNDNFQNTNIIDSENKAKELSRALNFVRLVLINPMSYIQNSKKPVEPWDKIIIIRKSGG